MVVVELLGTDVRRGYALHRERARSTPARVVLPLVLASSAQLLLIVGCVALGLPAWLVAVAAVSLAAVSLTIHRRTFGSLVAGAGIRVARPYAPGERVRLYLPSRAAVEVAEVVRVGPANTTLATEDGLVLVPNAVMLRGH